MQKSKIQAMEVIDTKRVLGVTKKDQMQSTDVRRDEEIQPTLNFTEERDSCVGGATYNMWRIKTCEKNLGSKNLSLIHI